MFSAAEVTRHKTVITLTRPNRVDITTIQLLSRNIQGIQLPEFDYLVLDEFHHAAARTYRDMLQNTSPKFLLGLTATPFRGDRQDIYELCGGTVLTSFELRAGVDTGILSPYHYFGCFDDIDHTGIKHNGVRSMPATWSVRSLFPSAIEP